mmetsp:Transcript_7647/g.28151  ORF Transcript_7647/g.28151 Transcript_7647/m.28151 type:complete len:212 (-) Transcript_7647:334-969(-)
MHFRVNAPHAHVRLVNLGCLRTLRPPVLEPILLLCWRVPIDAVVGCTHHTRFCHGPLDPRRGALNPLPLESFHAQLDACAVLDGVWWHRDLPHTEVILLHPEAPIIILPPIVEVANDTTGLGEGRPFTIHNLSLVVLREAELVIALCKLVQASLSINDGLLAFLVQAIAILQMGCKVLQVRVQLYTLQLGWCLLRGRGSDRDSVGVRSTGP